MCRWSLTFLTVTGPLSDPQRVKWFVSCMVAPWRSADAVSEPLLQKGMSHVLAFWTQQGNMSFPPWAQLEVILLLITYSVKIGLKNSALHLWGKNRIQSHHNGTGLISFRKVHRVVKLYIRWNYCFTAKSGFTDLISNALCSSFLQRRLKLPGLTMFYWAWFQVSHFTVPIFH